MTHTKLIFTFLFFIFLSTNLFAQVTQEWVARYNGPGNSWDEAHSIAMDDSGNVYVTGPAGSVGYGVNYTTIKYNSSGVQQWIKIWYRFPPYLHGINIPYSIAVRRSGVYVTGESLDTNYDIVTIKYSTSGTTQWVRLRQASTWQDKAYSLAVDSSGNVYVTGYSWRASTNQDYITIKYNTNGVEQWVKNYAGPVLGPDVAKSIAVDGLSNVYITGSSFVGYGTGWHDYATIKYNTNGAQQWVQRYNGPGNGKDMATSIAVDDFGNVYVTGYSSGFKDITDLEIMKMRQIHS